MAVAGSGVRRADVRGIEDKGFGVILAKMRMPAAW